MEEDSLYDLTLIVVLSLSLYSTILLKIERDKFFSVSGKLKGFKIKCLTVATPNGLYASEITVNEFSVFL